MKNTGRVFLLLRSLVVTTLIGFCVPVARSAGLPPRSDELRLDFLRTGGATFTNVCILPQTGSNLVITHAGGMATIRFDELGPDDAARVIRHVRAKQPVPAGGIEARPVDGGRAAAKRDERRSLSERLVEGASAAAAREIAGSIYIRMGSAILFYGFLASMILLPVHLLYSWFLLRVCEKAASPPGMLVWFPVLQLIPAHRAAGISPCWILGWPFYGLPWPFLFGALPGMPGWWGWLWPVGLLPALYLVGRLCVARGRGFGMVFVLVVLPLLATIVLTAFRAQGAAVLAGVVLVAGPYRVFAYPYLALAD